MVYSNYLLRERDCPFGFLRWEIKTTNRIQGGGAAFRVIRKDLKAVLWRHANKNPPHFILRVLQFLDFSLGRNQSGALSTRVSLTTSGRETCVNSLTLWMSLNYESVFWESPALSIGLVLKTRGRTRKLYCSHVFEFM